ncbi:DUF2332 domain-containing protein [Sphingomonas sp.]|uniref:DUF2332 domain-containing protein n=1 Tax=Sphingomonas sp. TaxID=28214 RepID=UPI001B142593|nr:DUF2332 domain-containing protein [Sphingomonas sp.]MBO9713368.1 DUF2332 domain-containing protein [Sphingomonas sp.]
MSEAEVRSAFQNQVGYCLANGAPVTAAVVGGVLAGLDGPGEFLRRIREWWGAPLADALPLRAAGGMHALVQRGEAPALEPLYRGEPEAMAQADALVAEAIAAHDAALLPWLDGPPQTNEAGRSANYVAAMLWLAAKGLPPRWDCLEIGSSAGINLMIDRYRYRLGGVEVGPAESPMLLEPEWRGSPPPAVPAGWGFAGLRGCDVEPIDLTDPKRLARLRAYVWPEATQRFQRLEAAARLASERAPLLVKADAADFVEAELARPQAEGTTRVLMHSIVWQYVPAASQARVTAAMEAAGAAATPERPLAWIMLEANRNNFRHELVVRHWPGDGAPHLLGTAHAHGAWVEWAGR